MTDEHLHDIDSLNSFPYIKSDCTPTVVPVPPINGNSPTVCEYLEIGVLPTSAPNEPASKSSADQQLLSHYGPIDADNVCENNRHLATIDGPPLGYQQNVEPISETAMFANQLEELHDKIEKWNDADSVISEFSAAAAAVAPITVQNAMPSHVFGEEFAAAVSVGDPIFDDDPMDAPQISEVPPSEGGIDEQMSKTTDLPGATQTFDDVTTAAVLVAAPEDGTVCNRIEAELSTGEQAPLAVHDTNDTAPSDVDAHEQDLPLAARMAAAAAVRPPQAINRTRPRKKRRRIVQLNDDSDSSSETEHNRNALMDSSESSSDDETAPADASADVVTDCNDRPPQQRTPSPTLEHLAEIVHNEKPGPKSKKASTQMIKEFQARALLKAAVVIPLTSGDNKRRKKRIIDDSDDEPNCDVSMSVEDIGMPDTIDDDGEPFEEIGASILLTDNEHFGGNDALLDGVEIDKIGEVVPIEMPVTAAGPDDTDEHEEQNNESGEQSNKDDDEDDDNDDDDDDDEGDDDNAAEPNEDNASETDDIDGKEDSESEENRDRFNSDPIVIKPISELLDPNRLVTNVASAIDPIDILTSETGMDVSAVRDSGNSTDSMAATTTAAAAAMQPKAQPQPRPGPKSRTSGAINKVSSSVSFAISSESSEEEHIPNELYFGTPDLTQLFNQARNRAANRARGRPVTTANVRPITIIPKQNVARRGGGAGTNMARRGRPPASIARSRRSPSSSDSDSPDRTRRKAPAKPMPPTNRPQYVQHQQPQQHMRGRPPVKKKKKKRSKDIPNEIYFGEVQVPLHVLHSYGADSHESASSSSSDSETEEEDPVYVRQQPYINMPRGRGRGITVTHISPPKMGRPPSRGRPGRPPHTASRSGSSSGIGHRESLLDTMKKYLKVAGLKKVNFKQLWENCKTQQERIDRIVELLREQGLEGEPNMHKCRQLRKEISAKKEIEDLDPNLIIQAEGRTRRSVARAATRRNYTYGDDENAQTTLLKLKKVIDSDSDAD